MDVPVQDIDINKQPAESNLKRTLREAYEFGQTPFGVPVARTTSSGRGR